MTTDNQIPRLIISAGEPAGIGPDIVIQAVQNTFDAEIVVVADPELIQNRAELLGLEITLEDYIADDYPVIHTAGTLKIFPVRLTSKCIPGKLDKRNANYVLESIKFACSRCQQKDFSGMVTAPVNKAIINEAGYAFSGHTEYLANLCGSGFPVMMLTNTELRVALVTTHLPLRQVSNEITPEKLEKVLTTVWKDLRKRFGLVHPRILVCGLNPHAGEDGYLGNEEKNIITPVIEKLCSNGIQLLGPLPADTAFTPDNLKNCDVIVCMYHDQGLPVIKALGFGETVNITLGLPVIRTSVDHGTALALAGTGNARCDSMISAIEYAIQLSRHSLTSKNINTDNDLLNQQSN